MVSKCSIGLLMIIVANLFQKELHSLLALLLFLVLVRRANRSSIVRALWLMICIRPHVIVLCNGPGTCIPLCVIAFLFKMLGIRWSSIFYVESVARVKKLSSSGLLLYKLRIADHFFVQWPQLQKKYPRAQYVGCLM